MNLSDFKKALLGGSLAGISCGIFFIWAFSVKEVHPIVRMLDFWIPAVFIGFFMWWIRETKGGQVFHFWQGLVVGNVIGFTSGVLSGITLFVTFNWISDQALLNYLDSSKQLLILQNQHANEPVSPEKLASALKEIDGFEPARLLWEEIFRKVSYCFVLVPLISIFFRRK
jgi:hypothetical protein